MFGIGFFVLVGLLVTAAAVKQASYILIHGSIFEPLRVWIRMKMEDGVVGFEKLSELFTCKVCMTTQVALWLVAIPLAFSDFMPQAGFVTSAGIFALATFSVSGMAVWFWNLSEYRVDKFEDMREEYETQIFRLRTLFANADTGSGESFVGDIHSLSLEQFLRIVEKVESACRGIGCGFSRRDCRRWSLRSAFADEARVEGADSFSEEEQEGIVASLEEALSEYFRERWRHKRNQATLMRFRRKTYVQFQRELV